MIDFVIIVTSGSKYLDIDAYACIVAYVELLNLKGVEARAVSTAPLNESIPPFVRRWPVEITNEYLPNANDTYILVDTSELTKFEDFVKPEKILEVIDHRSGNDKYWKDILGENAKIEHVGACATQIYEEWVKAGLTDKMSITSAKLLSLAILDNSLNFTAHTTTQRDIDAYNHQVKYADLGANWAKDYFDACQKTIESDIATAIINDTKIITFRGFTGPVVVGQLVIWDTKSVMSGNIDFGKLLSTDGQPWFMNIIDIKSGHNIIISTDEAVKSWITNLLKVIFTDDTVQTDGLYLRKEIIALDLDTSSLEPS